MLVRRPSFHSDEIMKSVAMRMFFVCDFECNGSFDDPEVFGSVMVSEKGCPLVRGRIDEIGFGVEGVIRT